ncbi:MAG TPA: class I SAM-dependent methyltransferase [Asanoa sp.]|nr:class I SAM-dependent methyltransferase [Asanoa sp.]
MFDYDAELRRHNLRLRAAAAVGPHDRVLDIGCGGGQTTREAAEAAVAGSAVGVDISPRLLEQARARSEGLANVTFQQADAQTHPFPPAHFDVCVSRFGTMFFADPVAAFTNIALALRTGARLVLLVWQDADGNEWSTVVRQALGTAAKAGPNPFSLADRTATEGILTAAGFTGISFTDVREPVYYGPDTATAYDAILELQQPTGVLAALDPAAADQARQRLRAAVAAHETASGVTFDSRAWLITARRDGA